MSEENLDLYMIRATLANLPEFSLPASYTIRWYQPGDEVHWLRIHLEADEYNHITPALFEREFGTDPILLAARQAYLCDRQGKPIGTASAWFKDNYKGQSYGRVHWVAILPAMQGRGLAKPLMSAVCRRLRELGHERAYLDTSAARLPAINLYLKFGFVPEIRGQEDLRAWRRVWEEIKHPVLEAIFAA